jgi:hypothetical protein
MKCSKQISLIMPWGLTQISMRFSRFKRGETSVEKNVSVHTQLAQTKMWKKLAKSSKMMDEAPFQRLLAD